MKKSHVWDTLEILQVRCPYCGKENEIPGSLAIEGCRETCVHCNKDFLLGKQG